MKKNIFLLSLVLVIATLAAGWNGQNAIAQIGTDWPPPVSQIIIKYKNSAHLNTAAQARAADQMQRVSAAAGVTLTYFRPMSGDAHVLRLPGQVPVTEAQQIAKALAALPEVAYAEPDYVLLPLDETTNTPQTTPNDPQYGNQWHYFAPAASHYGVDAPDAWDITTGSSSVYIAVLDTGITDHADLSGRWTGGYDMISNPTVGNDGDGRDSDPHDPGDWVAANECYAGSPAMDSSWHGTHVAGTIGAASNNGVGVAGLNWVSQVIPVRVLGKCGGSTSDIADAIRWAAGLPVSGVPNNTHPAQVINLSLGGYGTCDVAMQSAVNAAYGAGSTVVVAAGNSNANAGDYTPGNCNNVITIAATDRNGDRAYYSNYGATVEISAPGGAQSYDNDPNGVLSTLNTGTTVPASDTYEYYQGTSMAAPHVAGIVSLLYSVDPSITPAQALSTIQSTVTSFPAGSTCNTSICGSGIINAASALASLNPAPSAPTLYAISNPDGDGNYTVEWSDIGNATSYTLQEDDNSGFSSPTTVYNGTASQYAVSGKADGRWYYRVRASNSNGNSDWSNVVSAYVGALQNVYLPLILNNYASAPSGPTPGFWEGSYEEFYVTPAGTHVDDFAIYISVNGCGNYKVTSTDLDPISNEQFTNGGAFYYSGTFDTSTSAHGSEGLSNLYIPGCGYVSGGPWDWTATWSNGSQPSFQEATQTFPDFVMPVSETKNAHQVIQISP